MSWTDLFAALRGAKRPDPDEHLARSRRVRGLVAHLRRGVMELQAATPGPDEDQTYGVYDRQVAPLIRALRRELGEAAGRLSVPLRDLDLAVGGLAGVEPAEGNTPFELAMQALMALGILEREGVSS